MILDIFSGSLYDITEYMYSYDLNMPGFKIENLVPEVYQETDILVRKIDDKYIFAGFLVEIDNVSSRYLPLFHSSSKPYVRIANMKDLSCVRYGTNSEHLKIGLDDRAILFLCDEYDLKEIMCVKMLIPGAYCITSGENGISAFICPNYLNSYHDDSIDMPHYNVIPSINTFTSMI